MINQSTYENLSRELIIAAETLINELGNLLLTINKIAINDPTNINSKTRNYFEKELTKSIKKYNKTAKKWTNENVATAYLKGLSHANSILAENKLNKKIVGSITNGSYLIKSPPAIPPIPPIPGQVLGWFDNWENHIEFFGVFRNAAYYSIDKQPLQILRTGNDLFREVSILAGERNFKESDLFTRRKFSQDLLDNFAKKGLQSITYKDGKKVSIDSYSEMLGRTITGRAAIQASLNRYVETGYKLCIVSAHFRACPLCTPYEGKILSLDGKHPDYESIWDAELQGLFHPNCKHDISVYVEGISKPSEIKAHRYEQELIDQMGYSEAQRYVYSSQLRQRAIERRIRYWKRRSSVSLEKENKNIADKKVREWQKKQRDHLEENKYLRRKYEREQIKKAR